MNKTEPNFNHILIHALCNMDVDLLDFRELLEKIAENFGNLDSDIGSYDRIELSLKLEPYEVEQYSREYLLHKGIENRYILIVRVATELDGLTETANYTYHYKITPHNIEGFVDGLAAEDFKPIRKNFLWEPSPEGACLVLKGGTNND